MAGILSASGPKIELCICSPADRFLTPLVLLRALQGLFILARSTAQPQKQASRSAESHHQHPEPRNQARAG